MSFDRNSFREIAVAYLHRWQCVPDGEPFFTHSSLLWPALKDSTQVMLKIPNPLDDEIHGAEILKIFDGQGAVQVLESDRHIYISERIGVLGQSTLPDLVRQGDDDRATLIICDVIEHLHRASAEKKIPVFASPFRRRSENMLTNAARGRLGPKHGPSVQIAFDVSEELTREFADSNMLLHGDVHHFNVLLSERGWLAIDPKGIAGPRIYEYANSLVNPYMHETVTRSSRMERQAKITAERGQVDLEGLLRFTFVHAMQCATWSNSETDQDYWLACSKTAAKLAGLGSKTLSD